MRSGGGIASTNVGLNFIITVGANNCALKGSGTFNYFCFDAFNASGVAITNLLVVFPNAFDVLTCGVIAGGPFSTCTPSPGGKSILFSGGTGIPPGTGDDECEEDRDESCAGHFFIAFQGVSQGTDVSVQGNVPEPATLGLFLTGIGALVARRRLRKA